MGTSTALAPATRSHRGNGRPSWRQERMRRDRAYASCAGWLVLGHLGADGGRLRPHHLPAAITQLVAVGVPAVQGYRRPAARYDDPRPVAQERHLVTGPHRDLGRRLEHLVAKLSR